MMKYFSKEYQSSTHTLLEQ